MAMLYAASLADLCLAFCSIFAITVSIAVTIAIAIAIGGIVFVQFSDDRAIDLRSSLAETIERILNAAKLDAVGFDDIDYAINCAGELHSISQSKHWGTIDYDLIISLTSHFNDLGQTIAGKQLYRAWTINAGHPYHRS